MSAELTRPIIGIENRTPQEVFDIMCDRFKGRAPEPLLEEVREVLGAYIRQVDELRGQMGTRQTETSAAALELQRSVDNLRALLTRLDAARE